MGKLNVSGLDDFSRQLQDLGNAAQGIAKHALYEGAGAGRAAIEEAIRALPETKARYVRSEANRLNALTPAEKQGLLDHLGISKMETTGGRTTVSVSFDGYIEKLATKKYPNGLPAALLARSIESGSSVRQKHPFIRQTINRNREKIDAAMASAAEEMIVQITAN